MYTFAIDKDRLYRHFQKDPVLFAYHIGDLDDFYFTDCQYACIYNRTAHVEDCVLIYSGLETPTVLAFGLTDDFPELLRDVRDILPSRFFCHFQEKYHSLLTETHQESPLGSHIKMKLETFTEAPVPAHLDATKVVRLDASHAKILLNFYEHNHSTVYFRPQMLDTTKFLGYIDGGELQAVAGVHVYSQRYHVAVLGSIATAIDHRGEGLATLLTSRLCRELVDEHLLVCLNVKADNVPAIRCYEKLGFVTAHKYHEALFDTI